MFERALVVGALFVELEPKRRVQLLQMKDAFGEMHVLLNATLRVHHDVGTVAVREQYFLGLRFVDVSGLACFSYRTRNVHLRKPYDGDERRCGDEDAYLTRPLVE